MRAFQLSFLFSFATTIAFGQEKPSLPDGPPPNFHLVSVKKEGDIVNVRIAEAVQKPVEKMIGGFRVTDQVREWRDKWQLTLGKEVRAFHTDGKRANDEAVLKALSKPTGCACFIYYRPIETEVPDTFYLGTLREGSVALTINCMDIKNSP